MRHKQSVSSIECATCAFSALKYLNSVLASHPRISWQNPLRVCRMSIMVAPARCVLQASVTVLSVALAVATPEPRSIVLLSVVIGCNWLSSSYPTGVVLSCSSVWCSGIFVVVVSCRIRKSGHRKRYNPALNVDMFNTKLFLTHTFSTVRIIYT